MRTGLLKLLKSEIDFTMVELVGKMNRPEAEVLAALQEMERQGDAVSEYRHSREETLWSCAPEKNDSVERFINRAVDELKAEIMDFTGRGFRAGMYDELPKGRLRFRAQFRAGVYLVQGDHPYQDDREPWVVCTQEEDLALVQALRDSILEILQARYQDVMNHLESRCTWPLGWTQCDKCNSLNRELSWVEYRNILELYPECCGNQENLEEHYRTQAHFQQLRERRETTEFLRIRYGYIAKPPETGPMRGMNTLIQALEQDGSYFREDGQIVKADALGYYEGMAVRASLLELEDVQEDMNRTNAWIGQEMAETRLLPILRMVRIEEGLERLPATVADAVLQAVRSLL
jgi:hypothetical protein